MLKYSLNKNVSMRRFRLLNSIYGITENSCKYGIEPPFVLELDNIINNMNNFIYSLLCAVL